MGTITHKVMQTLGDKKIAMKNGLDFVEDEETGKKLSLEPLSAGCKAFLFSVIFTTFPFQIASMN